ncbi:MAG: hypothetical protein KatS3mg124_2429 [Porticoccaceae bacterium]|nr:MAG: hypothetical protein KatS3mg124_2429 [Porticoccaceae bacterium]
MDRLADAAGDAARSPGRWLPPPGRPASSSHRSRQRARRKGEGDVLVQGMPAVGIVGVGQRGAPGRCAGAPPVGPPGGPAGRWIPAVSRCTPPSRWASSACRSSSEAAAGGGQRTAGIERPGAHQAGARQVVHQQIERRAGSALLGEGPPGEPPAGCPPPRAPTSRARPGRAGRDQMGADHPLPVDVGPQLVQRQDLRRAALGRGVDVAADAVEAGRFLGALGPGDVDGGRAAHRVGAARAHRTAGAGEVQLEDGQGLVHRALPIFTSPRIAERGEARRSPGLRSGATLRFPATEAPRHGQSPPLRPRPDRQRQSGHLRLALLPGGGGARLHPGALGG